VQIRHGVYSVAYICIYNVPSNSLLAQ